ncbi:MAG: nucleotidyltransferase family protein [Oscillospiraceae bacterium]|nr:nucleotidyltransferase family protein [Oscillospiraceae bacterium]
MKLAGIICEYNPFHFGHIHQIEATKAILGEDTAIVAVMSGDFTQRGEPAIFPARVRAAAALEKADLVLELPLSASLSSAEGFARGGVEVLKNIGAEFISFGSESGSVEAVEKVSRCLLSDEFTTVLKPELEKGLPFAAARQKAAERIIGDAAKILSDPNDILAVEYVKAVISSGAAITPVAVKRVGAGHDSPEEQDEILSASAIRDKILRGEEYSPCITAKAYEIYARAISEGYGPVAFEKASQSLLYRLRTMSDEEYACLPYAAEGLHLKLKKAAFECGSISELISAVKSKRYPESGIRRMLLRAWLGAAPEGECGYIRVLGFNERGQAALRQIAKTCPVPVITKPAAARGLDGNAFEQFQYRARAASLYALLTDRPEYTIWRETPIHP